MDGSATRLGPVSASLSCARWRRRAPLHARRGGRRRAAASRPASCATPSRARVAASIRRRPTPGRRTHGARCGRRRRQRPEPRGSHRFRTRVVAPARAAVTDFITARGGKKSRAALFRAFLSVGRGGVLHAVRVPTPQACTSRSPQTNGRAMGSGEAAVPRHVRLGGAGTATRGGQEKDNVGISRRERWGGDAARQGLGKGGGAATAAIKAIHRSRTTAACGAVGRRATRRSARRRPPQRRLAAAARRRRRRGARAAAARAATAGRPAAQRQLARRFQRGSSTRSSSGQADGDALGEIFGRRSGDGDGGGGGDDGARGAGAAADDPMQQASSLSVIRRPTARARRRGGSAAAAYGRLGVRRARSGASWRTRPTLPSSRWRSRAAAAPGWAAAAAAAAAERGAAACPPAAARGPRCSAAARRRRRPAWARRRPGGEARGEPTPLPRGGAPEGRAPRRPRPRRAPAVFASAVRRRLRRRAAAAAGEDRAGPAEAGRRRSASLRRRGPRGRRRRRPPPPQSSARCASASYFALSRVSRHRMPPELRQCARSCCATLVAEAAAHLLRLEERRPNRATTAAAAPAGAPQPGRRGASRRVDLGHTARPRHCEGWRRRAAPCAAARCRAAAAPPSPGSACAARGGAPRCSRRRLVPPEGSSRLARHLLGLLLVGRQTKRRHAARRPRAADVMSCAREESRGEAVSDVGSGGAETRSPSPPRPAQRRMAAAGGSPARSRGAKPPTASRGSASSVDCAGVSNE